MSGQGAEAGAAAWHRRWPNGQIMALPALRLVYLPIAKCACTSLKRMMVGLSDHPARERLLAGDVHRGLDTGGTGLLFSDLDGRTVEALLADRRVFRFAVVRDPLERLVSAYVDKFVRARTRPGVRATVEPVLARALGRAPDEADVARGIPFRRFVEVVVTSEPLALDPHWRPQAPHFADLEVPNLFAMDDMDLLAAALEAHCGRPVPLEHRNRTRGPQGAVRAGAGDLMPNALGPEPGRIATESFFDAGLRQAAERFYDGDRALLGAAAERGRALRAGEAPLGPHARRSWRKRLSLNGLRRIAGRPPRPRRR